jgi:hypothetical protein
VDGPPEKKAPAHITPPLSNVPPLKSLGCMGYEIPPKVRDIVTLVLAAGGIQEIARKRGRRGVRAWVFVHPSTVGDSYTPWDGTVDGLGSVERYYNSIRPTADTLIISMKLSSGKKRTYVSITAALFVNPSTLSPTATFCNGIDQ